MTEGKRRPPNTAFRQQRLWACQPILTPRIVISVFLVIAIVCFPIGGLLLWANSLIRTIEINYTDCITQARFTNNSAEFELIPDGAVTTAFRKSIDPGQAPTWATHNETITYMNGEPASDQNVRGGVKVNTTVCSLQFYIPEPMGPSVFMYYRLVNFNQNHRRYVKSLDTDQLTGSAVDGGAINNSACDPLRSSDAFAPRPFLPYYPCGLIANSMFNDSFLSPVPITQGSNSSDGKNFEMTNQGIAWASDAAIYGNTSYKFDQIAVPPYWVERWPDGKYTADNGPPNLNTWQEFHNWMRTAGLPTFSKLALRNDAEPLPVGRYQVDIYSHFPVTIYGGEKWMFLSTSNALGGMNDFLGIAFLVVGGLYLLGGIVFLIMHLIKPRKLGDHTRLAFNDGDQATTTGASQGMGGIRRAGR